MKVKKIDQKIIYGISILSLLATGFYLLYNKPVITKMQLIDHSIGYVRPIEKDARIRGSEDLGWNSIRSEASVFQQDKVYTGEKSTAVISLNENEDSISKYSKIKSIEVPDRLQPEFVNIPKSNPVNEDELSAPIQSQNKSDMPAEQASRYLVDPRLQVYLGTGLGYYSYEQKSINEADEADFSIRTFPEILLGVKLNVNQQSDLQFDFSSKSGKIKNGDYEMSQKNKYKIQTVSSQYGYSYAESSFSKHKLLLGFAQKNTPLLVQNMNDTIDIIDSKFTLGSLGLNGNILSESKKYEYSFDIKYHFLLNSKSSSGVQYEAQKPLMVDVLLGASRFFEQNLKIGLYWYGESYKWDYTLKKDGLFSSGQQNIRNSSLQLRMNWLLQP